MKKWTILFLLCLPASAQTWISNVKKSVTTTSCTITWTTAVPTIGRVFYGTTAGSYPYHSATSTLYATSTKAVLSGLKAGTTYHFKITSADSTKDWVYGLDSTCTTATTTSQHSVQLNWQASTSSGVTGYDVYRSSVSGGYYGLRASVNSLNYKDTSVQSGATYYYAVTAVNSGGLQSKYSNQVKAVIP